MTALINNRLSSVYFFVTFAAMICQACLAFTIPHVADLWSESRAPMSSLQLTLMRLSRAAQDGGLAIITVSLFAASLAWRVAAAKRLRNSTEGVPRPAARFHPIHCTQIGLEFANRPDLL